MNKFTINLHRWITAVLLLSLSTNVLAQEAIPRCQSIWDEYDIKETHSIVRSNPQCRVVHIQHFESSTGMVLHSFLVDEYITGTSISFSTYFNSVDSTDYYVDITDMEILDGECYFCGTLIHKTMDMFSNEYIHEGFVGHFPATTFYTGSGQVVYNVVDQTSSLTRLAVGRPSNGLVKIHSIGTLDDDSTACLAEITCMTYPSWEATLNYPSNLPLIIFSDICSTRDSIILLAQNRCANDIAFGNSGYDFNHQIIMLDRFTHNGCYSDYNSAPIHYMAHYFFNDYENCNFHRNKTTMGLCLVYDNHFGVAFGVKEQNNNMYGLRYFSFPSIWQYDSSIYYRMGYNTWLRDLLYDFNRDRVLIVSRDNSSYTGVVTIPSMFNSSHPVRVLNAPGYTLNTLALEGGSSILNISSHNSTTEFSLLSQDIDRLNLLSCFDITLKTYTVFPRKQAALLATQWKGSYHEKNFMWITAEIYNLKTTSETVCKKCP